MGTLVPEHVEKLLDLGCGTGLELDEILQKRPKLEVTGIDLSEDMLGRLSAKHPQVHTIRADYFRYDFGKEAYDMAVSFESLHHFKPEKKLEPVSYTHLDVYKRQHKDRGMAVKLPKDGCDIFLPAALQD